MSLIIHFTNQSRLIKKFDSFLFFRKKQLIAFILEVHDSANQLFQLLFFNATLGKVSVFIKSCNYSSLYVIMHLWFLKNLRHQFLRRVAKPTRVFFHYGCPNSLVNVILLFFCKSMIFSTFWQVQCRYKK